MRDKDLYPLVGALFLAGLSVGCMTTDDGDDDDDDDVTVPDAAWSPDAALLDSPPIPDGPPPAPDAPPPPSTASLRITEINAAGTSDLVELVAATGGTLGGIQLVELTNSEYAFEFPAGYTVAGGDVILLHLGGACSDTPTDRASCGGVAPFSSTAWDFSMPGTLAYSGKVLELFAPDSSPMDGVPFARSSGVMPSSYVGAVLKLQSDGVWAATPSCIDDTSTGLAADRYCRNISVIWDGLQDDTSNSVARIAGGSPLAVPGAASAWSGALPATWGTY